MLQRLLNRFRRRPAPHPTGWVEVERQGLRWRLDMSRYVDREIFHTGGFEAETTRLVREHVKPGMHVLDVGANFGYFTTLLADLVGPEGHVWAFEPTEVFRRRLNWHLNANRLADRVTVVPLALSDAPASAPITVGPCSATMHVAVRPADAAQETIQLCRLDDVAAGLGIGRVGFVKVDIDGHEPAFFAGARELLLAQRPAMVVEFAQANLDAAGSDVERLRATVEALGYELRSETTGRPFPDRAAFMVECANWSQSANVWAFPRADAAAQAA